MIILALTSYLPRAFGAAGLPAEQLFSPAQKDALSLQYSEDVGGQTIRSRVTRVKYDVLEATMRRAAADRRAEPALLLNLFGDVVLELIVEKAERLPSGAFAGVGRVKDVSASEVILIQNGTLVVGNITAAGKHYQIRLNPDGEQVVREIDQALFPDELHGIAAAQSGESPSNDMAAGDVSPIIDVLVAYTADARSAAGGTAAMETLIDLAVTETNTGYANSGVNQRLRLVHAEEVAYSEASFNWSTTLGRLRNTSDGYIDNVHTLRDTYGADEVVLIVNNMSSCGIGYVMQTVSSSFASSAFAVVSRDCATGYYSFAHELGHNMGSAHDRSNAGVNGAYSYSYGYQAPDEAFRTIMAYDCPGGCTRVNYWSNAGVAYGGQPTGVQYLLPSAAENYRSLNSTGSTVEAFRAEVVPSSQFPWNLFYPAFTGEAVPGN